MDVWCLANPDYFLVFQDCVFQDCVFLDFFGQGFSCLDCAFWVKFLCRITDYFSKSILLSL